MGISKEYVLAKLQSLNGWVESEISTCYNDLDLIKNAGVAMGILTAIFTYIGYSVSRDAVLSYSTFSFFVFVVLFTIINFISIKMMAKAKKDNKSSQTPNPREVSSIFISDPFVSQIIAPLLSSLVVIYFSLFLLHAVGLSYSGIGLRFDTLFALTSSCLVNTLYALSVVVSVISVIISFRKNRSYTFLGYGAATLLIEAASFAFVLHNSLVGYPAWSSYQLWLTVIIEFLLYFALIQYQYATNAKLSITKYKNELSIIKANIEHLMIGNLPRHKSIKSFYEAYVALETEYQKLEKPKLVISEGVPLVLGVYVTLDMSREIR